MHVWMHAYVHSACRCVYVHVCLCVTNFTMINACSWDVCIHTVAQTLKEKIKWVVLEVVPVVEHLCQCADDQEYQSHTMGCGTNYLLHSFLLYTELWMQYTTSPTPWAMGPLNCFTAFCFIQGSECNTPPVPYHGLWDHLSASQLFASYRALNATHHQVLSIIKEPEEMSSIQVWVFGYLLTTIENMKRDKLSYLLRFVTGSSVFVAKQISVFFQ